jgi:hypothetical protein
MRHNRLERVAGAVDQVHDLLRRRGCLSPHNMPLIAKPAQGVLDSASPGWYVKMILCEHARYAVRSATMADDAATNSNGGRTRTGRRAAYLLLLIPFIALLWVPFYATATPTVAGMPFFYWYQFLWILISTALTGIVYALTR